MTFNNFVDYKFNNEWDIFTDHRGDLAYVTGRAAFEQSIQTRVQENISPIIGRFDDKTVEKKARLAIRRVANDLDQLERISDYTAKMSDENQKTLEIEVVFDTGEPLTFDTNA